jgi:hypothetical protein
MVFENKDAKVSTWNGGSNMTPNKTAWLDNLCFYKIFDNINECDISEHVARMGAIKNHEEFW